ncbi:MAG: MFS transporter [Dermatophilaceae bacterium]
MSAAPPAVGDDRLWTPSFVALSLANLCVSFTFYVLVATLAGYAVNAYSAGQAQAGLVSSIFFIGAMLARLVAGRVLTAYGARRVVVWSLVALGLTCVAYLFPSTMASMLAVRTLHGIAYGFAATALASAVMADVPGARRGEGSGWFTTGMAVATGAAPFVGMTLARGPGGQQSVFLVTILACLVALGAALGVVRSIPAVVQAEPGRDGLPAGREPSAGRVLAGLVDRRALPIGAVVGLCAFPFAAILAFLASHAEHSGLQGPASTYFLVYAAVILVSRPAAGVAQDRLGDVAVVVPVISSLVLGSVVTALATTPLALLCGAALLGLGYGTLTSVGQAIAVAAVGREHIGLGVSSYFLLVEVGTGLGPVLLGSLVDPLGYAGMFVAAAGFAVLGLLLYLTLARPVVRRR